MPARTRRMSGDKEVVLLRRLQDKILKSVILNVSTLDPLAKYLDRRRIPSLADWECGRESAELQVSLAVFSFGALLACDKHLKTNSAIVTRVGEMLTDVWSWASFILSQTFEHGPYTALLPPIDPQEEVLDALGVICRVGPLKESLLKSARLEETVFCYWIDEGNQARGKDLDSLVVIVEALMKTDDLTGAEIRPLVKVSRDRYGLIARAALRHLRRPFGNASTQTGAATTVLVYLAHCRADRRMLDALLYAGALPSILRFLDHVASRPRPPVTDFPYWQHAVVSYCMIIEEACSASSHPIQWAMQLVHLGVLEKILQVPDLTTRQNGQDATEYHGTLCRSIELFHRFMVCYPFIKGITKRLRRHDMPQSAVHWVNQVWGAFLELAARRIREKEQFDDDYTYVCHFTECTSDDDRARLRMCSGCEGPRYCSVACQRADWPSHREACLEYQKSQDEPSRIPVPLREEAFILHLTDQEIESRIGELKNLVATKYPGTTNICDLFVNVDWNRSPPFLAVASLVDALGESSRMSSHEEPEMLALVQVPWESKTVIQHVVPSPLRLL